MGWCHKNSKPENVPFRFRKIWLEHNQFMNFVKLSWCEPMRDGPIRLVMRKLKRLKGTLKAWHKATYWGTRDKIAQANKSLKDIQKQQEQEAFDVQLHLQEMETEKLISNLMNTEATMWKQRASIKEELEGDRNSAYFQAKARMRQAKYFVEEIKTTQAKPGASEPHSTGGYRPAK
ncbi:hypothetical protein IFM89_033316 [Coptis chinensis]|uniref:Uncharacterized protein n=1 Tax=Coptis chinensis TaxID=261450 RepID=A0A835HH70_9MAGN|nr:hypothetical protein IFM89_033316 [Coptis chinensis]